MSLAVRAIGMLGAFYLPLVVHSVKKYKEINPKDKKVKALFNATLFRYFNEEENERRISWNNLQKM